MKKQHLVCGLLFAMSISVLTVRVFASLSNPFDRASLVVLVLVSLFSGAIAASALDLPD